MRTTSEYELAAMRVCVCVLLHVFDRTKVAYMKVIASEQRSGAARRVLCSMGVGLVNTTNRTRASPCERRLRTSGDQAAHTHT